MTSWSDRRPTARPRLVLWRYICDSSHMEKGTIRLYRNALRYAAASIPSIAADMEYHRNTLDGYLNQRTPSPEAVRRLVGWLREHGARFLDYADRLEAAAGEEKAPTARTVHRRGRGGRLRRGA